MKVHLHQESMESSQRKLVDLGKTLSVNKIHNTGPEKNSTPATHLTRKRQYFLTSKNTSKSTKSINLMQWGDLLRRNRNIFNTYSLWHTILKIMHIF